MPSVCSIADCPTPKDADGLRHRLGARFSNRPVTSGLAHPPYVADCRHNNHAPTNPRIPQESQNPSNAQTIHLRWRLGRFRHCWQWPPHHCCLDTTRPRYYPTACSRSIVAFCHCCPNRNWHTSPCHFVSPPSGLKH